MLKGVAAVAAGFIIMIVAVMAGSMAMMAAFVPGGLAAMKTMRENPAVMPDRTPRYYVMNFAIALVAAILGAWVTSKVAGPAPRGQLIALCVVILAMGLISAFTPGSAMQPNWYKLALPFIGVTGVAITAAIVRA
jgi:hypothetical protein